jgi:hypothetical protein
MVGWMAHNMSGHFLLNTTDVQIGEEQSWNRESVTTNLTNLTNQRKEWISAGVACHLRGARQTPLRRVVRRKVQVNPIRQIRQIRG